MKLISGAGRAAVPAMLLACSLQAVAVEAPKTSIALWGFGGSDASGGLNKSLVMDFNPTNTGLEMMGVSSRCIQSAPDAAGKVKVTFKTRFNITNLDGTAVVSFDPITFVSGAFPQGPAAGTYNLSTAATWYFRSREQMNSALTYVDSSCDSFPVTERFGVGIARGANSARVAVFSQAALGAYWNQADGSVDVSKYIVAVHNASGASLSNGSATIPFGGMMWNKSFTSDDPTLGSLVSAFSSVADFLNNDGIDEVRIAWSKGVTGGEKWTYKYFDVVTGALIMQKQFTVPKP